MEEYKNLLNEFKESFCLKRELEKKIDDDKKRITSDHTLSKLRRLRKDVKLKYDKLQRYIKNNNIKKSVYIENHKIKEEDWKN